MENETNQTNTSTENKQNWFKQHLTLCIIVAVIVVAAVVGVILLTGNNKTLTPEDVAKTYVEAMSESNPDKLLSVTDYKGAYAWEKANKDVNKFLEEYKNAQDSDVNSYKDKMKTSLEAAMGMLKAFGGVEISLKEVSKTEDLGNGLFKVNVSMQMKAFGETQDQTISMAVYNGKYIGKISE